jgi:hypothetical protein
VLGPDPSEETAEASCLALVQGVLHAGMSVMPGPFQRLGDQGIARGEMGVKATMGQPGLFHDVRHTNPGKTATAQSARRRIDDAVMRLLLAAGSEWHGVVWYCVMGES